MGQKKLAWESTHQFTNNAFSPVLDGFLITLKSNS